MPTPPTDPARLAECHQRRAAGASPREIARAMGVSERTIFRWLRTAPVEVTPPAAEATRAELRSALAQHAAELEARRAKLGR